MKGIQLAERFYREVGAPTIRAFFPDDERRIAVGFVGEGSDCFGYDDAFSQDHDFGPSFDLWIPDELSERLEKPLKQMYDYLPKTFEGVSFQVRTNEGSRRHGVSTVGDFYARFTGRPGAPETWQEWMTVPSYSLAAASNGKVFYDEEKTFSAERDRILNGMPQDVRLQKLAASTVRMAQAGQYNYLRCLRHGERGAARLALDEFVRETAATVYLLKKRHMPFYKWVFRGLRELGETAIAERLELLLQGALSDTDTAALVEEISAEIIVRLKKEELTASTSDYLEAHAAEIRQHIENPMIRALHIMEG